jgi:hypothetical protein
MTIGLNDQQLADDLFREVDGRIAQALEAGQLKLRFGQVDSIDAGARKAAVFLGGQSSPGFVYGEHPPAPGDTVAVAIAPDGARMILRITSRDVDDQDTFAFFVS